MTETYTKKEVIDGKVWLIKTVTSDISKETALERFSGEVSIIQTEITHLQSKLRDVQAKIAAITKITVTSEGG